MKKFFGISIIYSLIIVLISILEDNYDILISLIIIPGVPLGIYLEFLFVKLLFGGIGKLVRRAENLKLAFGENEFFKYKGYYREILEIDSPLILGYIDNLKINKSTLIAQLLYMERKGIINITGDLINTTSKKIKITNIERQIINNINNNKLIIYNFDKYIKTLESTVHAEAQRLRLIKKDNTTSLGEKIKKVSDKIKKGKFWKGLIFTMLILNFLIFFIDLLNGSKIDYHYIEGMVLIFISFTLLGAAMLYAFAYFFTRGYEKVKSKVPNLRTKKGKKLNERLEGLKNYINDFSLLSERESKQIVLWEDYLIYSVIFEQNKKIVKEFERYIEINK